MPEQRGQSVTTSCFVDSDHAGCRIMRRSHTGVIVFVNNAPILWYSKRQSTVKSSTFGSEFVALRTAIDTIEGLRYKLRMMSVPFEGPTSVFCDNEGVVKNTTEPESPLKKKHVAICTIAAVKLKPPVLSRLRRRTQRRILPTRLPSHYPVRDDESYCRSSCGEGFFPEPWGEVFPWGCCPKIRCCFGTRTLCHSVDRVAVVAVLLDMFQFRRLLPS
jgi:hypothetical protein